MILVSGLTVGTIAGGLPWLIKGFKVEHVEVPVQSSTNTLLPEVKSVLGASVGNTVIASAYFNSQNMPSFDFVGTNHQLANQSRRSKSQWKLLNQRGTGSFHRLVVGRPNKSQMRLKSSVPASSRTHLRALN